MLQLSSSWRRRLTAACVVCASGLALAAPTTPTTPVLRGTTDLNNLPTLGDAARADLSPVFERKLGEEIMNDIRATATISMTIRSSST
jgi:predicted Zn-dependent protease